jgi:DNA invertase Pin-like site-specific DNA recombinase
MPGGTSFVSVTQQFATTTSMARLTLNFLLSFASSSLAQFERELIGDRVRDKIAASKQKGMWMGGEPPLGYRVQDRKLAIVDSEAEILRSIFRRYAELGSVGLLRDELETQSVKKQILDERLGPPLGRQAIRAAITACQYGDHSSLGTCNADVKNSSGYQLFGSLVSSGRIILHSLENVGAVRMTVE